MKIRGTDFVMDQVSDRAGAARSYGEAPGLPQRGYSEARQWKEFDTHWLKGAPWHTEE